MRGYYLYYMQFADKNSRTDSLCGGYLASSLKFDDETSLFCMRTQRGHSSGTLKQAR